ncbi:hypothetical protein PROFUN_11291 [Planoprotostelium fungivorum]|uniref:Uncharacterized protein n=1 Tax=Planoprotostelium fungivorum TaxID=1890364 RepID=A0A2P6N2I7_9EUKA|nr:hypothetical protein PROFUN_11291 [Planoprotostelium fungivorum]
MRTYLPSVFFCCCLLAGVLAQDLVPQLQGLSPRSPLVVNSDQLNVFGVSDQNGAHFQQADGNAVLIVWSTGQVDVIPLNFSNINTTISFTISSTYNSSYFNVSATNNGQNFSNVVTIEVHNTSIYYQDDFNISNFWIQNAQLNVYKGALPNFTQGIMIGNGHPERKDGADRYWSLRQISTGAANMPQGGFLTFRLTRYSGYGWDYVTVYVNGKSLGTTFIQDGELTTFRFSALDGDSTTKSFGIELDENLWILSDVTLTAVGAFGALQDRPPTVLAPPSPALLKIWDQGFEQITSLPSEFSGSCGITAADSQSGSQSVYITSGCSLSLIKSYSSPVGHRYGTFRFYAKSSAISGSSTLSIYSRGAGVSSWTVGSEWTAIDLHVLPFDLYQYSSLSYSFQVSTPIYVDSFTGSVPLDPSSTVPTSSSPRSSTSRPVLTTAPSGSASATLCVGVLAVSALFLVL